MTTEPTAKAEPTAADLSPGALGIVANAVKALFKSDPAAARTLVADSAVAAAVKKATDDAGKLLEGHTDSALTTLTDQWTDGPDDKLETKHAHGPGSSVESGKVNIGPPQAASGDGAEKMVREYSSTAPQGGVQRATEMLGRQLGSVRKAVVLMHKALEGHALQADLFRSAIASLGDLESAVAKAVEAAVAKAMPGILEAAKAAKPAAVAKGEKESEKEGEKASQKEGGSGTEIEIVNEQEEEDEAEAKSVVAAAVKAKSFLAKAKDAVVKAVSTGLAGNAPATKAWGTLAMKRLAKAAAFDPSDEMAKAVVSVGKALKGGEQNQDVWPATEEKKIGKADVSADPALMAKAIEQIEAANRGLGLLQGSVADLFKVVGAQPRTGAASLPPVFELVKSETGAQATAAKIDDLVAKGMATEDDGEHAKEVLVRFQAAARGDMDQRVANSLAARLPAALRAVFVPVEQAA